MRKLQREQDPKSPFVFTSEPGSPFYFRDRGCFALITRPTGRLDVVILAHMCIDALVFAAG